LFVFSYEIVTYSFCNLFLKENTVQPIGSLLL